MPLWKPPSLNRGQRRALMAKLEAALRQADRGNCAAAAGSLGAFITQVNDWRGTLLSDEEADTLIAAAEAVLASCS